jgi:protein subunit release factor A
LYKLYYPKTKKIDAILEIRAGTGGDEAALFARELWDAYIQTIGTGGDEAALFARELWDAYIQTIGTGGDEAALFARELWDAYIQTIHNMNKCASASWKLEILTESSSIKEGSLLISGKERPPKIFLSSSITPTYGST